MARGRKDQVALAWSLRAMRDETEEPEAAAGWLVLAEVVNLFRGMREDIAALRAAFVKRR